MIRAGPGDDWVVCRRLKRIGLAWVRANVCGVTGSALIEVKKD